MIVEIIVVVVQGWRILSIANAKHGAGIILGKQPEVFSPFERLLFFNKVVPKSQRTFPDLSKGFLIVFIREKSFCVSLLRRDRSRPKAQKVCLEAELSALPFV